MPLNNTTQWATVAQKSYKLPDPPVTPLLRRLSGQTNQITKPTSKVDKHLLVRLEGKHEWRRLSPITIKKIITERAGVAPSAVIAIYLARLGVSFGCAFGALRETILNVGPSFQQDNVIIEAASE